MKLAPWFVGPILTGAPPLYGAKKKKKTAGSQIFSFYRIKQQIFHRTRKKNSRTKNVRVDHRRTRATPSTPERARERASERSYFLLSLSLSLYIYIYIFICFKPLVKYKRISLFFLHTSHLLLSFHTPLSIW